MDKKHNGAKIRLAVICGLCILLLVFAAVAPMFEPNNPNLASLIDAKQPPSEKFPWGTDWLGRCILSRVLDGAAISIYTAIVLVVLTVILGCAIGILCGYFGGIVDSVFMRIVDIFMAFPGMVLALAVAGMLGKGLINASLAMILTGWPQYARLSRSYVLSMREENYIRAAKLNGQSLPSIMFKHILPNTLRPIIVTASLSLGGTILSLAGMSFLGLGAQPPSAEWGSMLADGRGFMQLCPWIVFYPGLAILITSVLFNLLGDSVRDVLDPLDSTHIFSKEKKKKGSK